MMRLLSFLVATIFLVSATVEIGSFVLDHKSWFYENYKTAVAYIETTIRSAEPSANACDKNCGAAPQNEAADRCAGKETFPQKLICRFMLPVSETPCRQDCDEKGKPLPGNWIRPEKGSTASLSVR
jgi:hypothetical protein